jgi:hypothetical protein
MLQYRCIESNGTRLREPERAASIAGRADMSARTRAPEPAPRTDPRQSVTPMMAFEAEKSSGPPASSIQNW